MKCNESVKVFTVRGTSFEPAAADGGSGASEEGTRCLMKLNTLMFGFKAQLNHTQKFTVFSAVFNPPLCCKLLMGPFV